MGSGFGTAPEAGRREICERARRAAGGDGWRRVAREAALRWSPAEDQQAAARDCRREASGRAVSQEAPEGVWREAPGGDEKEARGEGEKGVRGEDEKEAHGEDGKEAHEEAEEAEQGAHGEDELEAGA